MSGLNEQLKNFAVATVFGLYDASTTEIRVVLADADKLPNPTVDGKPFYFTWYNKTNYPNPSRDPLREICKCTARNGNILTIERGARSAENGVSIGTGSLKNLTGRVYEIIVAPTAELLEEIAASIDTKASDSSTVHKTGNETIAGVKTFSNSPIVPTPTTDMQTATKKYVDDAVSGENIFNRDESGNITPNTASDKLVIEDIKVDNINEKDAGSGVTIDGVNIKDGLVDGKDIAEHVDNTNIHFTQAEIEIAANQISDFDTAVSNNTDVAAAGTHIADLDIHFTQEEISIPSSQISDFDTEVGNNTDVAANTSARHTHGNKALLDVIDQELDSTSNVAFNKVVINETPTNGLDATNKNYVDNKVAETSGGFAVESIVNTPVVSPLDGQRWLIGTSPTGDFIGHPNEIATYIANHYEYLGPTVGKRIWIKDQDDNVYYSENGEWISFEDSLDHEKMDNLLGGDIDGHFHLTEEQHIAATTPATETSDGIVSDEAQTFGGEKTFAEFPKVPNESPTEDTQVANKLYVDILRNDEYIADRSKVVNNSGSTIALNKIVVVSGHDNILAIPEIVQFNDPNAVPLGITISEMLDGEVDTVLIRGRHDVTGFDTTSIAIGTKVYVDPTGDLSLIPNNFCVGVTLNQQVNGFVYFDFSGIFNSKPGLSFDDYTWQRSVKSNSITEAPATPTIGDRYIVPVTATGSWAAHLKTIAEWNGISWTYHTPTYGWTTWVEELRTHYIFGGTPVATWKTLSDTIGSSVSNWTNSTVYNLKTLVIYQEQLYITTTTHTSGPTFDRTKFLLLSDKINNFTATVNPIASDDASLGYSIGSTWINTVTQKIFTCFDATLTAAVWKTYTVPATQMEVPTGLINGINKDFVLSQIPDSVTSLFVTINGLVQHNGVDFTLLSDTITFTNAPVINSEIWVIYNYSNTSGGLPDSVTSVNMKIGAVSLTADDIPEGANNHYLTTSEKNKVSILGSVYDKDVGIGSGEIPTLDTNGKLPTSTLPQIAIAQVTVVLTIAVRDLLVPNTGDIAIVTTDPTPTNNGSYIWDGSIWQVLSSIEVTSVDGQTGVVNLSSIYEPKNTNIQTHISIVDGNPHGTSKADLGLDNVTNAEQIEKSIGTTKGDLLAYAANNDPRRVAIGTNGQILTADDTEITGVKWVDNAGGFADPLTTQGDILARDFTSTTRFPLGAVGQILTVDPTSAFGFSWKDNEGAPENAAFSEQPGGVVDGINKTFTITKTPANPDALIFTINGVVRVQGVDFTISGSTITTTYAPQVGSSLYVFYAVLGSGAVVGAHSLLSSTHLDTVSDMVLRGDIIVGNATPKWARLAFPETATGKILQATATDVEWSTNPITIGTSASISGANTGDETNATIKTKLGVASTGVDGYLSGSDWTTFNSKQAALGFTPEDVANKENITLDTSSTKYPTNNLVKTYVDNMVTGLLDYRGGHSAVDGTFPTTGGSGTAGAVIKGNMWVISADGVLGGVPVQIGDSIIANIDTPAQSAENWNILNGNISYVPENVANKVTSISETSTDTQYPGAKLVYDQLAEKQANITQYSETPTGLVDGVNTSYTLSNVPMSDNSVHLFVNGIHRDIGIDFTISGANITMLWAPAADSIIFVQYTK